MVGGEIGALGDVLADPSSAFDVGLVRGLGDWIFVMGLVTTGGASSSDDSEAEEDDEAEEESSFSSRN